LIPTFGTVRSTVMAALVIVSQVLGVIGVDGYTELRVE